VPIVIEQRLPQLQQTIVMNKLRVASVRSKCIFREFSTRTLNVGCIFCVERFQTFMWEQCENVLPVSVWNYLKLLSVRTHTEKVFRRSLLLHSGIPGRPLVARIVIWNALWSFASNYPIKSKETNELMNWQKWHSVPEISGIFQTWDGKSERES